MANFLSAGYSLFNFFFSSVKCLHFPQFCSFKSNAVTQKDKKKKITLLLNSFKESFLLKNAFQRWRIHKNAPIWFILTYLCARSPTAANQSPHSGHSSVGAWCLESRFHADENNPPVLAASRGSVRVGFGVDPSTQRVCRSVRTVRLAAVLAQVAGPWQP